ncbi:MAG: LolA family protein [Bacteroidota bacterium]
MTKTVLSILMFFMLIQSAKPQNQAEALALVDALKEKMMEVVRYEANVTIQVDVDFINIKERQARVTFQQPDQFDLKTTGFTLLPRKGAEMEYLQLLYGNHTALYEKEDTVGGHETSVVKIIPMTDETDIILAQIWIQKDNPRLLKMNTFTKSNGSFTMRFFYADHPFDMPDKIEITFDIKSFMLPASLSGDLKALEKKITEEKTQGKVILTYSDYRVNE